MAPRCPKCSSPDVEVIDTELSLIHCRKCGFNELEEEIVPVSRNSQREKQKFTPYKSGGHQRTKQKQHG